MGDPKIEYSPPQGPPAEPPKFITMELERLHEILTHPNSNTEIKKWTCDKIDQIYSVILPIRIVIAGVPDLKASGPGRP